MVLASLAPVAPRCVVVLPPGRMTLMALRRVSLVLHVSLALSHVSLMACRRATVMRPGRVEAVRGAPCRMAGAPCGAAAGLAVRGSRRPSASRGLRATTMVLDRLARPGIRIGGTRGRHPRATR